MTRRDLLFNSYLGLGGLALLDLLQPERLRAGDRADNPMDPKPPQHAVKAKNCIFLFMEGGVSQMDTY